MAVSNTAFDYERARRAEMPSTSTIAQPPELRVVEGRAARTRVVFRRAAVFFLLLMGLLAAILYNRMVLTELTTEVETARSQYNALVSENRRMQVELESKTSLKAIEESAAALGMAKAESYQISYIDLGEEEEVILTEETPGILSAAASAVFDWVSGILGRLGL